MNKFPTCFNASSFSWNSCGSYLWMTDGWRQPAASNQPSVQLQFDSSTSNVKCNHSSVQSSIFYNESLWLCERCRVIPTKAILLPLNLDVTQRLLHFKLIAFTIYWLDNVYTSITTCLNIFSSYLVSIELIVQNQWQWRKKIT